MMLKFLIRFVGGGRLSAFVAGLFIPLIANSVVEHNAILGVINTVLFCINVGLWIWGSQHDDTEVLVQSIEHNPEDVGGG